MLRKYLLILSFLCLDLVLADERFNEALRLEQEGKTHQALELYKELAQEAMLLNEFKQDKTQKPQIHTLNTEDTSKNKKEENESLHLALANYMGEDLGVNVLGISAYKMNYFFPISHNFSSVSSTQKASEAKFQISIKKRLFENLFGLNEAYYLAYSQISWWQIYQSSTPFRESSYEPEFFMNISLEENQFYLKNLKLGFLHQSNGKGENNGSRSWNRVYFSSVFEKDNFVFIPRVYFRIPESAQEDDNPDINAYMGNFDLNVAYLQKYFFINIMLRNNLRFNANNKGAIQFDLGLDLLKNGIFWYVQYFNGYGESLIDYNRSVNKLSAGFLIAF